MAYEKEANDQDDEALEETVVFPKQRGMDETVGGAGPLSSETTETQVADTGGPGLADTVDNLTVTSTTSGEIYAGRFVVESELGHGGMGRVYLASDKQIDGRRVALKVLLPKLSENEHFRSLFFTEIDAASRFVSEHVVQVRDTGQLEDGKLFLTMDYVEGESLDKLLEREGTLGVRHSLEVARQILLGLGSGHAKGYVHRDLKPSNVLLAGRVAKTSTNPHGVAVRLLDFGIAGLAAKVSGRGLLGTPNYMSPEQLLGEQVDLRSDLFAVGVVLYELLAGERPFGGNTLKELTESVLEADVGGRVEELSDVPKSVRTLLRKALRKDRDKRYQSAAEFVGAIERLREHRGARTAPGWTSIVATVAVLGAVGEGAYIATNRVDASEQITGNSIQSAVNAERLKLEGIHRKELEELERAKEAEIVALRSARADRDTTILSLQGDVRGARDDLKGAEGKIMELNGQLEATAKNLESLRGSLATAETLISQQNVELQAYKYESRREVVDARSFDNLVALLFDANYKGARDAMNALQRDSSSYLNPSNESGGALLAALVEGFNAAALLEAGGGVDADQKELATLRLAEAEVAVKSFSNVAFKWIQYAPEEGGTPPPRQSNVESLVKLLEGKLSKAKGQADSMHEASIRGLRADPIGSSPAEVIAHGRVYECQHLQEILASYVDELVSKVEGPNGSIAVDELAQFPNLLEWEAALEALDPGSPARVDEATLSTLREVVAARRWFVEKELNPWLRAQRNKPVEIASGISSDWRAQMRIQARIWGDADKDTTSTGTLRNPMLTARMAYYRVEGQAAGGQVRWYRDAREAPADRAAAWTVTRTILQAQDSPRVKIGYSLDGHNVLNARQRLFSLAAAEGVKVATWTPPDLGPLPGDLGLPSTAKLEQLKVSLEERPLQCLVLTSEEGKSYWISPEVGLVQIEQDGAVTQQLVYFTRE